MQTLANFATLSGLHANMHKSHAYISGCPPVLKRSLLDILGIPEGALPVRYLGVPLVSSRLRYQDCSPLLDAISRRISSWTTRLLSFAGRLELIRSVLFGQISFWCSAFSLPKKLIHRLSQLLSRFLWTGADRKGHHKVAWISVCQPKSKGGLGLRNIEVLNQACLMRYIWDIITKKDSLWVRWVHGVYLTDCSLWTRVTPRSVSWCFRSILAVRDAARNFVHYLIGDGSRTLLWHDPWNPEGILYNKLGEHHYSIRYRPLDTVSSILHQGQWSIDTMGYVPLLDAWRALPSIVLHDEDGVSWCADSTGRFTLKSTYLQFFSHYPEPPWVDLVWFKGAAPRHSFLAWLACHGSLTTMDRLYQWQLVRTPVCPCCGQAPETTDHLFFNCAYSKEVWRRVLLFAGRDRQSCSLQVIAGWRVGSGILGQGLKLCFTASIYYIWCHRNRLVYQGSRLEDPNWVAVRICSTVCVRLYYLRTGRLRSFEGYLGSLAEWAMSFGLGPL